MKQRNPKKGGGFNADYCAEMGKLDGVILTDQIENLDWRTRRIDIVGRVSDEVVEECLDKIHTFL